jgi:hypothetical protein
VALGGLLPFALDLAVEAAPVGKPAEFAEAREFVEMTIGDLQFFFARGKLGRHVVEGCGKRCEFGDPRLLRGADVEVAAAKRVAVRTSERIGRTTNCSPPNQAIRSTKSPKAISCR